MPDLEDRTASVRAPSWGGELPRFERLLADLSARFINLVKFRAQVRSGQVTLPASR